MNRKVIIVIPALNEEKTIWKVINSLPKKIVWCTVEIVVIDDWCTDETVQISYDAWANMVISHPINKWVWAAFKTSVDYFLRSEADILVNIDADGQFPADRISDLVKPIAMWHAAISIWSRFGGIDPTGMPTIKFVMNQIISGLIGRMMWWHIEDLTCWFRAYSRESLLRLYTHSSFTYTQEVIIDAISKWLTIAWIPVKVTYFEERESRVVKSILWYMTKSLMIIFRTVRDAKPLIFFGIPWIILSFFWILWLLWFVVAYVLEWVTTPYRMVFNVWSILLWLWLLLFIFASVADMIKRQRRISEENLYMNRKIYYWLNSSPFHTEEKK